MGKSASGKDTVFSRLIDDKNLSLERMVPYTTRPMRSGEKDGVEYHFTDLAGLKSLRDNGKVIEERCYHTVHGDWYYFTVDDENVSKEKDYLLIGTLEVYEKLVFGKKHFSIASISDASVPAMHFRIISEFDAKLLRYV